MTLCKEHMQTLADLTLTISSFFEQYGLVKKFSVNAKIPDDFLQSRSMQLRLRSEILAKYRNPQFSNFQFQNESFKELIQRIISIQAS